MRRNIRKFHIDTQYGLAGDHLQSTSQPETTPAVWEPARFLPRQLSKRNSFKKVWLFGAVR
jgi:hypothetical protein